MKKIIDLFLGKKYYSLSSLDEKIQYISSMIILTIVVFPLVFLGTTMIGQSSIRVAFDFTLAGLCLIFALLVRTILPVRYSAYFPITAFGVYCLYLLYEGTRGAWPASWTMAFPILSIYLTNITFGVISSSVVLAGMWVFLLSPWQLGFYNIGGAYLSAQFRVEDPILSTRFFIVYLLIFIITVIYNRIIAYKNKQEKLLSQDLVYERNTIKTMKDNMNLGIFLMDKNLTIQPEYSQQLLTILSKYNEKLDGKNFLDIIGSSLSTKQINIMMGYFDMIFQKSRSLEVLAEANPLSEFEYKVDDRTKYLSAKFNLIEQDEESVYILSILEDITQQKEYAQEFEERKREQEAEMKDLFDVIQINPMIFEDFIETVETNFEDINSALKNELLSSKEIVTKLFQSIHAIKSNATILGLDNFASILHNFESEIKLILNKSEINEEDVFSLTLKLDSIMKEKDRYQDILSKLNQFKSKSDIATILKSQLEKAVAKISQELSKIVNLNVIELNSEVLETKLRKPIKEILLQFIRNSINHGIKTQGELKVSVKQVDNTVVVDYSDNGKGLDYTKLKEKYLKLYPGSEPTKSQLSQLIFRPEVSTANTVSTIAGRGVGLSLVKDLVSQYKGKLSFGSSEKGLIFKIVFPILHEKV